MLPLSYADFRQAFRRPDITNAIASARGDIDYSCFPRCLSLCSVSLSKTSLLRFRDGLNDSKRHTRSKTRPILILVRVYSCGYSRLVVQHRNFEFALYLLFLERCRNIHVFFAQGACRSSAISDLGGSSGSIPFEQGSCISNQPFSKGIALTSHR